MTPLLWTHSVASRLPNHARDAAPARLDAPRGPLVRDEEIALGQEIHDRLLRQRVGLAPDVDLATRRRHGPEPERQGIRRNAASNEVERRLRGRRCGHRSHVGRSRGRRPRPRRQKPGIEPAGAQSPRSRVVEAEVGREREEPRPGPPLRTLRHPLAGGEWPAVGGRVVDEHLIRFVIGAASDGLDPDRMVDRAASRLGRRPDEHAGVPLEHEPATGTGESCGLVRRDRRASAPDGDADPVARLGDIGDLAKRQAIGGVAGQLPDLAARRPSFAAGERIDAHRHRVRGAGLPAELQPVDLAVRGRSLVLEDGSR